MSTTSDSLPTDRIPVIGVIGGIGSGKSAVTRCVAERLDIERIDADELGHQALRLDSVKNALKSRFGTEIFDEQGDIVRRNLAKFVFGDSDSQRAAKSDLERIVHPAIESLIASAIIEARKSCRKAVLLDAAVLLEAGWGTKCDTIVFVDAPDEIRWRRVHERSGWSLQELHKREASQLSLEEKKNRSHIIISNSTDDDHGCKELFDFLCREWINC